MNSTEFGVSSDFGFALNVGLVNRTIKNGKKKFMLLFMWYPEKYEFLFIDQYGVAYHDYSEVRKIAKRTKQKICVIISLKTSPSMRHHQVMIDNMRGDVSVFDNSGVFGSNGNEGGLYRMIREMTRRRIRGYSRIHRLPKTCPRINESRPYCTYWSALFLKYILDHPTKTIGDFVKFIMKMHGNHISPLMYYVDSMIPVLREIACREAPILVARGVIESPPECNKNLSLKMKGLKL